MLVVGRPKENEIDCEGGATPANARLSPWPEIKTDQYCSCFSLMKVRL
jgi:hypothetical protein